MDNNLVALFLGFFGWFAANFLGGPIISLYEMRKQIKEEVLYSLSFNLRNINEAQHDGSRENLLQNFFASKNSIRRLAAKLLALSYSPLFSARLVKRLLKIDINLAVRSLREFSIAMKLENNFNDNIRHDLLKIIFFSLNLHSKDEIKMARLKVLLNEFNGVDQLEGTA